MADPEWNATKDYPSFPHITTESHEGFWKPWSVCHSAPEWVVDQTIDKESILKKKQRIIKKQQRRQKQLSLQCRKIRMCQQRKVKLPQKRLKSKSLVLYKLFL